MDGGDMIRIKDSEESIHLIIPSRVRGSMSESSCKDSEQRRPSSLSMICAWRIRIKRKDNLRNHKTYQCLWELWV